MTVKLYDGDVTVTFTEGNHRYKINGNYTTGVTTILGILGKEHLIQWAANMAVKAMQDGIPPEEARYAHVRKRDKSADTGHKVHDWIENHLKGFDKPIDKDMRPSVNAYLKWESGNDIEFLASEQIIYSRTYDYAGTYDVRFKLNGVTYMADFKTSDPDKEWDKKLKRYTGKHRPRTEHLMQCALYDQAHIEEHGEPADRYMAIYITKDGKLFTFESSDTEQIREAALSVVKTYQLHKQLNFRNEWR